MLITVALCQADGRSAVWLPAGCMILTKPLVFNTTEQWAPGLKLEGAGVGVTVLDNQVTNSAAVIARSVTKYHFQLGGWIRDLTINSSTHPFNSSGVEVEGVYNFVVDSVRVDGMTGDGMINTNLMMDGDGAVELQILNSWFLNNEGHGFNSHFGFCNNSLGCTTPNVQSSFATFKNNYFASNHKAALRYMGLNGIIEGNGFTTNPAGGLLIDYSGSNNAQITVTANSFENNGSPAIDVRSAIGASFVETEIAQSVPLDFPSNAGIAVGTNVLDKWQVVYTTVFEDTYVRVDPRTGGVEGYTMFELGEISNLVQIKNTLWHQFDGKHHTRYRDKGTSNRLSDAFETTVAGPSMLMLHEGANDDVSLPYLKGYSPLSSFTEDTGTLFGFAASGNATLSGIVQGIENRRLVLVNEGSYLLTVLAECAKSCVSLFIPHLCSYDLDC